MSKIQIRPAKIASFGPAEDAAFFLVTNAALRDEFEIVPDGGYARYEIITHDREGEIRNILLERLPASAHVLVISPLCFFRSPQTEWLGPRRKLLAMACNSTPTSLEAIAHFVKVIEDSQPEAQEAFADTLFEGIENAEFMTIEHRELGTRAVFRHWQSNCQWNQQAGRLGWGEQQIAPPGEISVLPADIWDFDEQKTLQINGEIVFHGPPILHSGEPSFLREDQARLWQGLRPMTDDALILTVEQGMIRSVRAATAGAQGAVDTLETMFRVDSRYRILWELGFAVNTTHQILPGNFAMNEVYGSTHGALHFGIGLTPYTQYHLDVICPGTRVHDDRGRVLLGARERG